MTSQKKTDPKPPEGFGIYVRNFSTETKQTDLVKYFSQFGNVIWAHFGHDYLLLDFTENEAVRKVMTKNAHFLNGKRLFIRHKLPTLNVKVPINDEEINNQLQQSIVEGLQGANDFDEELKRLIQKLQPNQLECWKKQQAVCNDLGQILSKRFNRIEVHQFGSTMTGLGFDLTSDVDVYLANVKFEDNEEVEVRLLHIIKNMLVGSRKFGNTFVIGTTKIPIVKCLHLATQIPCDINVKNMIGVWNSKLIHYYLSLDPMIKPCMICLKYWAKNHQVSKKTLFFTNYSLVMLFLFYLQNVFCFPSVHQLQQHPNLTQINNWVVDFIPLPHFYSQSLAMNTTLGVLKGFFEFYSQFDFKTYIIVPYLGQKFSRQDFESVDSLPESCLAYKNYLASKIEPQLKLTSAICLQDPIEHFRNITTSINDSSLEHFIILCKFGLKICLENDENVLLKLLTKEPLTDRPTTSIQEDCFTLKFPNSFLEVVVKLLNVALCDILCFTMVKDDEIFNYKTKTNMWSSRKVTSKEFNLKKEVNLIQRELAITRHLKERNKDFQTSNDILEFKLSLEAYKEELVEGVTISVHKLQSYKKTFKSFARFFTTSVPLWLQAYQRDTILDNDTMMSTL